MAGTNVYYNGIQLENVVTRDWDEDVTYDASGTDAIGVKYRLSFEGIAHVQNLANAVASIAPLGTGAASSLSSLWKLVTTALSTPRRILRVTMGSQTMLVVNPTLQNLGDIHRDVENGPKPKNVKISHVAGASVLRVKFTIEAVKLLCPNKAAGPVLSNRWAVQESLDHNFCVQRSIRGRLRLSTSLLPGHAFKGMVVPLLERGFKRDRIQFTVAENGLDCEYEITDKQVHQSAPAPATTWNCAHTESTNDGVTMISGVSIHLEAPPNVDKRDLIVRAIQIADTRLNFLAETDVELFIEQFALVDHIGEANAVDLSFTIRRQGATAADFFTQVLDGSGTQAMGQPVELPALAPHPGYSPQISQSPKVYGYTALDPTKARDPATLLLLHCYLQDPCSDKHDIAQYEQRKIRKGEGGEGERPTIVHRTLKGYPFKTKKSLFARGHRRAMYTHAQVKNVYKLRQLRAHLPIARRASSMTGNDDTSVALGLGAPMAQRVITVDAERVGAWPELPVPVDSYRDGGLRGVLLDHDLEPHAVTLAPDGSTKVYRVTARYVYALNRPPRVGETPALGSVPYAALPAADQKVQAGKIFGAISGARLTGAVGGF